MNKVINFWDENKNRLIEGLFVSLIAGWMLVSLITNTYNQIGNQTYSGETNMFLTAIMLIVGFCVMAILYFANEKIARILMFVFIYLYMILCAYTGYSLHWMSMGYEQSSWNNLGNVMLTVILSFIAVLAFLYVKDDIFGIFKRFKIGKRTMYLLVAVVGILTFAVVGIATVSRYYAYTNSTFDFGIFAQMYEYMRKTGLPNTTVERNVLLSHFGVHYSPIFYVGLPIYILFPSPVTVQLIQAFMIALPVIPIVLLGRKYKFSNWMIVAMTLIYALYPATMSGSLYDIHENCFLTFLLLMAIWAVEKKHTVWMIVFTLLTCTVKEDAAFYILILGVYFIISKREVIRGIILSCTGGIYFVLVQMIMSSQGTINFNDRFSNLYYDRANPGLFQIAYTVISNPAYAISQIVNNGGSTMLEKVEYLLLMFVPIMLILFAIRKHYSRLLLLVPLLLFNLMTSYVYMHVIIFQYNFGTIAFITYIIIMNLSEMDIKKVKTYVAISTICASIMFMGSMAPRTYAYYYKSVEEKERCAQYEEAISKIPKDSSVVASGILVPHLYEVLDLYDISNINEAERAQILGKGKSTELPQTDYIIVTASDFSHENLTKLLDSGKYEKTYEEENTVAIYKRVAK